MRISPAPSGQPRGFTLIELMATLTILTLILTMALQVVESSRNSIRVSQSRAENEGTARRVFSQLERDFAGIVVRPDVRIELDSRQGDDRLAFLTRRRGLAKSGDIGARPVSLVAYEIDRDTPQAGEFLRGSIGYQYGGGTDAPVLDANKPFPTISGSARQTLSIDVLRLEIEYLIRRGDEVVRDSEPPKKPADLRGLVVTIATIDSQGRRAIGAGRMTGLAARFPDASPARDTLVVWSKGRDDLVSDEKSLPREALQSIRCFQRTLLLP